MDPSDRIEQQAITTPHLDSFKSTVRNFTYSEPSIDREPLKQNSQAMRRVTRSTSKSISRTEPSLPSPAESSRPSIGPAQGRKSQSPRKRTKLLKRKRSAGYAPPSTYAHIDNNLSDSLVSGLICVFIGLNPGLTTATTGHAYAHPSNLFWRLLASSGCTPRRCAPSETHDLNRTYGIGNTNIVSRATANGAELSRAEMDAGVAVLDEKIEKFRPEAVAIVGKSIWESIWRVWKGRPIRKEEFRYGWQDDDLRMGRPKDVKAGDGKEWNGARVFVATSTSGLAASVKKDEKEAIWRKLGEWVEAKRQDRGLIGDRRIENGNLVVHE